MKKVVLIFTGLVLMIYSLNLFALNASHSLKGRIIDSKTKAPIACAGIVIKDSSKIVATVTDEDGSFILFDVSDGNHSIQIYHPDYESTVKVITVSDVNELALNIEMNRKSRTEKENSQVKDVNIYDKLFWNFTSPVSFFDFLKSIIFSF